MNCSIIFNKFHVVFEQPLVEEVSTRSWLRPPPPRDFSRKTTDLLSSWTVTWSPCHCHWPRRRRRWRPRGRWLYKTKSLGKNGHFSYFLKSSDWGVGSESGWVLGGRTITKATAAKCVCVCVCWCVCTLFFQLFSFSEDLEAWQTFTQTHTHVHTLAP